jgi:hypothetical protein
MSTHTTAQLQRAGLLAEQIALLERARLQIEDMPVTLNLGGPTNRYPMGMGFDVKVNAVVSANDIRAALHEQLAPLYAELRNLGFELQ